MTPDSAVYVGQKRGTHRGHMAGQQVPVLGEHVGHHEGGQLGVRVRVDQAVVRDGVTQVAGLGVHQVQQRRLGVIGWGYRGDLVVLVSPSSAVPAAPSLS